MGCILSSHRSKSISESLPTRNHLKSKRNQARIWRADTAPMTPEANARMLPFQPKISQSHNNANLSAQRTILHNVYLVRGGVLNCCHANTLSYTLPLSTTIIQNIYSRNSVSMATCHSNGNLPIHRLLAYSRISIPEILKTPHHKYCFVVSHFSKC